MPFRTPNDLSYSKLNLEDFDEQIYHPQGRRDNTIKRFGVGLVSICLLILVLLSYVIYSLSQAQISSLSDYGALFKNSLPRSGHGIRRYKFFEDGYDDEDFAKGDPFWASDYPGMETLKPFPQWLWQALQWAVALFILLKITSNRLGFIARWFLLFETATFLHMRAQPTTPCTAWYARFLRKVGLRWHYPRLHWGIICGCSKQ